MSPKTAIVTGVSSFVGCHLAHTFAMRGWRVVAVVSKPQGDYDGIRAERLTYIADHVEFATCDLTNEESVGALAATHQPDLWIQHAGYATDYASPQYDLEKSFPLNVLALEPLYKTLAGTKAGVIITGSSMEYASSDQANREDDVCWPELPYGVSKLTQTVEASRLARQYGVPTRVVRLYIPVGPFDAPGKLMSYVVEKLLANEAADLSPCTQRRDFLGVDDLCEAYVKMTEDFSRQIFDVFNICSGEARELKSLLLDFAEIIGANPALLNFNARSMREGETPVSYGDNDKARAILDWHPHNVKDALVQLVETMRSTEIE